MRLTPGVFLRRVVLRFSVISSARVLRRVQVALCDKNAMGGRGVSMSGVVSSVRWKSAGKRIHPGAPAEQAVSSILSCAVRVRAAHPELAGIRPGYATEITFVILVCAERMFHPGFADLFEAIIIVRPTAHPIEVHRDNRMIGVWYGEKVHWLIAVVARSRADAEADLSVASGNGRRLHHGAQIANDNVRPGHGYVATWNKCVAWRQGR